ncbi:hypothetical protein EVAR_12736_1 [Eumeta japonica]|uniref:Uncharacterized protein n=1 Tax=Eumeta variegata TaxID=151549 RepID=A0A4C1UND5_EUMVA|nr:hypothetical protein EVAR_12736_1 [Eumeta japonica]
MVPFSIPSSSGLDFRFCSSSCLQYRFRYRGLEVHNVPLLRQPQPATFLVTYLPALPTAETPRRLRPLGRIRPPRRERCRVEFLIRTRAPAITVRFNYEVKYDETSTRERRPLVAALSSNRKVLDSILTMGVLTDDRLNRWLCASESTLSRMSQRCYRHGNDGGYQRLSLRHKFTTKQYAADLSIVYILTASDVGQQRWVKLEFYVKRLAGRFPFPRHTVATHVPGPYYVKVEIDCDSGIDL